MGVPKCAISRSTHHVYFHFQFCAYKNDRNINYLFKNINKCEYCKRFNVYNTDTVGSARVYARYSFVYLLILNNDIEYGRIKADFNSIRAAHTHTLRQ